MFIRRNKIKSFKFNIYYSEFDCYIRFVDFTFFSKKSRSVCLRILRETNNLLREKEYFNVIDDINDIGVNLRKDTILINLSSCVRNNTLKRVFDDPKNISLFLKLIKENDDVSVSTKKKIKRRKGL